MDRTSNSNSIKSRKPKSLIVFLFICILFTLVLGVQEILGITCPNGVDNIAIQTNWVMQAQYGAFQAAVEMGYYDNECLNVVIKLGKLSATVVW